MKVKRKKNTIKVKELITAIPLIICLSVAIISDLIYERTIGRILDYEINLSPKKKRRPKK